MRFNAFAATFALIFYRRRVHVMGRRPRANERRQFACAKRLGFGTSARLRSRYLLRYVPKTLQRHLDTLPSQHRTEGPRVPDNF